MIILHISPVNMKTANGLRYSVLGLVSSQNKIDGVRAGLMSISGDDKLDFVEVQKMDFDFMKYYNNICNLKPPYNNPDIVVFHGIYFVQYIHLYKQLVGKNIPYIIVPRSSLTNGAQRQKFIKKKIGNCILFNKFINNSTKIHYLTQNEAKESEGFDKDFFIVGNGTNISSYLKKSTYTNNINITYIGRYDINQKGLDILLSSIILIRDQLKEKKIIINLYGTEFRGGKNYLEKEVSKSKISDIFKINDPVFKKEKEEVLKKTDIFISTSRFEGHPMAIIEAMSYGIPCILTEGTNMVDILKKYDAGWATKLDPYDISIKILEAIDDIDLIIRKGNNARRLVKENYTWNKIALKTINEYKKIIKNNY